MVPKGHRSKRDRSGDKYRYEPKQDSTPMAPDKESYRDELKHLLGKKVLVNGILGYNSEGDYCKIQPLTIIAEDIKVPLKYVWVKKRKFLMNKIKDNTVVSFTAIVRMYNSGGKIKYGLLVLNLKEICENST